MKATSVSTVSIWLCRGMHSAGLSTHIRLGDAVTIYQKLALGRYLAFADVREESGLEDKIARGVKRVDEPLGLGKHVDTLVRLTSLTNTQSKHQTVVLQISHLSF
jgi:hypothetical protein